MRSKHLRRIRLGGPLTETSVEPVNWLWHGYLRPGDVTLFTGRWKTGKTTLLADLLRHFGTGEPFLDRAVRPGKVWVISEEPADLWEARERAHPIGEHVDVWPRPFVGRPTPQQWSDLIDDAADAHAAGELDLFVVDSLGHFLPGHCESNAGALLDALRPLHRLTTAGAAVLLHHHPRKKEAEAGDSARGSGALLGFVDVIMELSRYGKLKTDAHRRLIFARGRRPETPERLAYEWDAAAGEFRTVLDPRDRQFAENWATVEKVLAVRGESMTCAEIATGWPDDAASPSVMTLYSWLHAAHAKEIVKRTGAGTKHDPYRFRLRTTEDDEHARYIASLPPVPRAERHPNRPRGAARLAAPTGPASQRRANASNRGRGSPALRTQLRWDGPQFLRRCGWSGQSSPSPERGISHRVRPLPRTTGERWVLPVDPLT